MPSPDSASPRARDDYFNDLTRQPWNESSADRRGSREDSQQNATGSNENTVPKQKRIACVLCRKRKLKCDSGRPACGTCKRLQHHCSYDEVRRKSGPKRGYVKALEARLAQVETLLTKDDGVHEVGGKQRSGSEQMLAEDGLGSRDMDLGQMEGMGFADDENSALGSMNNAESAVPLFPKNVIGNPNVPDDSFPWEMIGLGLDEALPTQDVVNDLNDIYFEKVHVTMPMIHRARYHAAMNLPPHMRPPICLRYFMWAHAASTSDKYDALKMHFYLRARKYIQQDELKGQGEGAVSVGHCQAWALCCMFEFKNMLFPRAWMSAGRACRLALMMGLHRQDGMGMDVKQCIPPAKDHTEREERRRTFWICFMLDRCASTGTGWPMTVVEEDIRSLLPGEDDAFENNRPSQAITLKEALNPRGTATLSPAAGVALMCSLFGRNVLHLYRPGANEAEDDLNGEYWKRHRAIDDTLVNIALTLPDSLRLHSVKNNSEIIFLNMALHSAAICLHLAAIYKADTNGLSARVSVESKVRCITAAAEIASLMKNISHVDLSKMNPFLAFFLYVAARVFIQYLKNKPNDLQIRGTLLFLLAAMNALKRRSPLVEAFLMQLDLDMIGAGLQHLQPARDQEVDTTDITLQSPKQVCPYVQMKNQVITTYGSEGPAEYSDPSAGIRIKPGRPSSPVAPEGQSSFDCLMGTDLQDFQQPDQTNNANSWQPGQPSAPPSQFDLPQRQRASPSDGQEFSQIFIPTMGMPDVSGIGSGSGSGLTPGSTQQNSSSHTSHTGFSPPNQQYALDAATAGYQFDNNVLPEGFDFDSFTATDAGKQSQGFVLTPDGTQQSPGGTTSSPQGRQPYPRGQQTFYSGFAPGAAATPGGGLNPNDLMNISESEWSFLMQGM